MNLRFTKRDIRNMVLSEGKDYKVFQKKNLMLKEVNDTEYVDVNSGDRSSAMEKINNAYADGNNAVMPASDLVVGSGSDEETTILGQGDNAKEQIDDAVTQIHTLKKNGMDVNNINVKTVNPNMHLNASVKSKPTLESLNRNAIPFTKKELNELLRG